MTARAMDLIQDNLNAVAEGLAFEERFGRNASRFLVQLPPLFHLFRRVAFDLDLPDAARHLAAAAALYVAEPSDFLRDEPPTEKGLIDDVWLAYAALARLRAMVDDDALARHWRSGVEIQHVLGLAENVSALEDKVPSHVLDRVARYLGAPR